MSKITITVPDDFFTAISIANGWTEKILQKKIEEEKINGTKSDANNRIAGLRDEGYHFLGADVIDDGFLIKFYKHVEIDNPISQDVFAKQAVKKLTLERYSEAKAGIAQTQAQAQAQAQINNIIVE